LAFNSCRARHTYPHAATETTSDYQMTWTKGQSGNPAGRPKGSKHKLQTSFWNDLHRVWKESGPDALRRVAQDDPSTFVRVCASLMPKEETAKQIEHAIEVTLKEPEWMKLQRLNSEPLTIEQQATSEGEEPDRVG
jgi:hypothetical protein